MVYIMLTLYCTVPVASVWQRSNALYRLVRAIVLLFKDCLIDINECAHYDFSTVSVAPEIILACQIATVIVMSLCLNDQLLWGKVCVKSDGFKRAKYCVALHSFNYKMLIV